LHYWNYHGDNIMRLSNATIATLLTLGGCSCNEEYNFKSLESTSTAEADFGRWLQMDNAPDGSPVAAFYDDLIGGLGFAVGTEKSDGSISWALEAVDGYPLEDGTDTVDVGSYTSMAVDGNGEVWLSYYNNTDGGLKVAHRVGGEWSIEDVDSGESELSDAGTWTSIAIDANEQPVVAHHDRGLGTLRLSRHSPSGWSTSTILTGDDFLDESDPKNPIARAASAGQYANLLVDGSSEYVASYDAALQRLDLLSGGGTAFSHSVVFDSHNAGKWPSMLMFEGNLHIAFQDLTVEGLSLAVKTTSGFVFSTIDAGPVRGADSELFSHADNLYALFFDGYENDMMLASRDGSAWNVQSLAGPGRAVGFHNEVATLGDTVLLGSFDLTNHSLHVSLLP
jgi:hypothetical protein